MDGGADWYPDFTVVRRRRTTPTSLPFPAELVDQPIIPELALPIHDFGGEALCYLGTPTHTHTILTFRLVVVVFVIIGR